MKNLINCSIKGFILFSLIALITLMPSCLGIVLFEAPDTAQSGTSIYVKVRVKTDVLAQYGISVAFVLSYDQIYDEQDLRLKIVHRRNIPIAAHEYQDIGTYLTIPNNYYAGKYFLLAIPHETENLFVYPEQQNVFYKPITITNNPNYGSDLVTTNVHVYSPVTINEAYWDRSFTNIQILKDQMRVVFTLENRGFSTANASSLYFYFYNSSNRNWHFLGATSTPSLGSHGRWEATIYADLKGRGLSSNTTYQLYIFTDFTNTVSETREDNNVYTNRANLRVPNALQNEEAELLTVASKNAINKALMAAKIEGIDVLSSTSTNESIDNELNKTDKIADTPSVFTLFPNPSSEKVTVSFHQEKKSDVIIQIFDAAGKNINSVALSQVEAGQYQQEIPLTGLSKGVYIVKCMTGQKVFTQKLVVN